MTSEEIFEPGDFVDWKYTREDWPYAKGSKGRHFGTKYEETVGRESKNAKPPPYKVGRVIPVPEENRKEAGHAQHVGLLMFPRGRRLRKGAPSPDLRHFSGALLRKVKDE